MRTNQLSVGKVQSGMGQADGVPGSSGRRAEKLSALEGERWPVSVIIKSNVCRVWHLLCENGERKEGVMCLPLLMCA